MKTFKGKKNRKDTNTGVKKKHRQSKSQKKNEKKSRKHWKSKEAKIVRCEVNTTCLEKATKYMKVLKDNVENYFKQEKRMTSQNKTAGKTNTG